MNLTEARETVRVDYKPSLGKRLIAQSPAQQWKQSIMINDSGKTKEGTSLKSHVNCVLFDTVPTSQQIHSSHSDMKCCSGQEV